MKTLSEQDGYLWNRGLTRAITSRRAKLKPNKKIPGQFFLTDPASGTRYVIKPSSSGRYSSLAFRGLHRAVTDIARRQGFHIPENPTKAWAKGMWERWDGTARESELKRDKKALEDEAEERRKDVAKKRKGWKNDDQLATDAAIADREKLLKPLRERVDQAPKGEARKIAKKSLAEAEAEIADLKDQRKRIGTDAWYQERSKPELEKIKKDLKPKLKPINRELKDIADGNDLSPRSKTARNLGIGLGIGGVAGLGYGARELIDWATSNRIDSAASDADQPAASGAAIGPSDLDVARVEQILDGANIEAEEFRGMTPEERAEVQLADPADRALLNQVFDQVDADDAANAANAANASMDQPGRDGRGGPFATSTAPPRPPSPIAGWTVTAPLPGLRGLEGQPRSFAAPGIAEPDQGEPMLVQPPPVQQAPVQQPPAFEGDVDAQSEAFRRLFGTDLAPAEDDGGVNAFLDLLGPSAAVAGESFLPIDRQAGTLPYARPGESLELQLDDWMPPIEDGPIDLTDFAGAQTAGQAYADALATEGEYTRAEIENLRAAAEEETAATSNGMMGNLFDIGMSPGQTSPYSDVLRGADSEGARDLIDDPYLNGVVDFYNGARTGIGNVVGGAPGGQEVKSLIFEEYPLIGSILDPGPASAEGVLTAPADILGGFMGAGRDFDTTFNGGELTAPLGNVALAAAGNPGDAVATEGSDAPVEVGVPVAPSDPSLTGVRPMMLGPGDEPILVPHGAFPPETYPMDDDVPHVYVGWEEAPFVASGGSQGPIDPSGVRGALERQPIDPTELSVDEDGETPGFLESAFGWFGDDIEETDDTQAAVAHVRGGDEKNNPSATSPGGRKPTNAGVTPPIPAPREIDPSEYEERSKGKSEVEVEPEELNAINQFFADELGIDDPDERMDLAMALIRGGGAMTTQGAGMMEGFAHGANAGADVMAARGAARSASDQAAYETELAHKQWLQEFDQLERFENEKIRLREEERKTAALNADAFGQAERKALGRVSVIQKVAMDLYNQAVKDAKLTGEKVRPKDHPSNPHSIYNRMASQYVGGGALQEAQDPYYDMPGQR